MRRLTFTMLVMVGLLGCAEYSTPVVPSIQKSEMLYPYDSTVVYPIYTARRKFTDIQLQPGECLLQERLAGPDQYAWEVETEKRKVSGVTEQTQWHVIIQPKHRSKPTSLRLATNRRIYSLILEQNPAAYLPLVRFSYPHQAPVPKKRNAITPYVPFRQC